MTVTLGFHVLFSNVGLSVESIVFSTCRYSSVESMENLTASTDPRTSSMQSVPIYNASSSHQHSHACSDPSHHHHHFPSSADASNAYGSSEPTVPASMPLKKTKPKKSRAQDVTRTELLPGFRGDRDIDDLVQFINGSSPASSASGGKKSKKKATENK